MFGHGRPAAVRRDRRVAQTAGASQRTTPRSDTPWAQAPYDPFAQAWTAEHDWGLTEADLAELTAEQEGEAAYTEALRAAVEQLHSAGKHGLVGDRVPDRLRPTTPPMIRTMERMRTTPTGSFRNSMPTMAVPAAPMPVQAA